MAQGYFDETKATARLPNLDIEIVHSCSPEGDAERITISLASGALLRGIWPFPGGHKSVSILDALRSDGLGTLAWLRPRQSAAGNCHPSSGTAAKRRT
jgi:hypothetical protein